MPETLVAQPDVNAIELAVLAFWKKEGIFCLSEERRQEGVPFVIYDGPPTANAKPASHHAILARLKI